MTWAEFKDFLQKNFGDDQVEKPKVQAPEPTIPRSNNWKSSAKAWRKKKKNRRQNDKQ